MNKKLLSSSIRGQRGFWLNPSHGFLQKARIILYVVEGDQIDMEGGGFC